MAQYVTGWPNAFPQPQPPESQAPTKPGSSESPAASENKKERRLLAAGSGFGICSHCYEVTLIDPGKNRISRAQ